jgi:TonB family protein
MEKVLVMKRSMSLTMASLVLVGTAASAVGSETAGVQQKPVDIRGIWKGDKLDKKGAAARGIDAAAVRTPRKVKNESPRYPQALVGNVGGPVELECTIDKEGVPTDCSVTRRLHALLDAEALRSVSEWRYSPLTIDGEAVPALVHITVVFMSERDTPRD